MIAKALTILAALSVATQAPAEIQLRDREIRLHDLAEPIADSDGVAVNPVLARIPQGVRQIGIDEETALRLIRSRIPTARPRLTFDDRIVLKAPPQDIRKSGCFAAARTIEPGQFIATNDVVSVPCDDQAPVFTGFDKAASAPFARRRIESGSQLGPIRPISEWRIAANRQATLITGSDRVEIARKVTTLQSGREGRMVFVQTPQGDAFPVPTSMLKQE